MKNIKKKLDKHDTEKNVPKGEVIGCDQQVFRGRPRHAAYSDINSLVTSSYSKGSYIFLIMELW